MAKHKKRHRREFELITAATLVGEFNANVSRLDDELREDVARRLNLSTAQADRLLDEIY